MSAAPVAIAEGRARSLDDVADWIFDLDNTLYPAHCRLFDQVDRRIGLYIQELLNLDPEAARACRSSISGSTARP